MAASKASISEMDNENITCTICIDIFKDPRTLSCLHTFCCQCLQNYIDKQDVAYQKKGFRCPVCRYFVAIPNPTAGWAAQMKHDFRIESMLGGIGKTEVKNIEKCFEGHEESKVSSKMPTLALVKADNPGSSADNPGSSADNDVLPEDAELSGQLVDVSSEDMEFSLINTIDASTYASFNTEQVTIHDIVVLNQDGMEVFVISYDNTVKALWHDPSKDMQMKSSLVLEFTHSKLTKMNEKLVAITAYKNNSRNKWVNNQWVATCDLPVMLVHVKPHLSVKATVCVLKNDSHSYSIAVLKSKTSASESRLVVGLGSRLCVIDLHGNLLKSLSVDTTGEKLCEEISDLTTTTSGNIIVTGKKKVVCVTLEGERLWEYPVDNPWNNPVIVHSEAHSNIFVTSSKRYKDGKRICKVIQLSPEGKFVRDVLTEDHRNTPISGVFFDGYKGRLYVTWTYDIRIYECKKAVNNWVNLELVQLCHLM